MRSSSETDCFDVGCREGPADGVGRERHDGGGTGPATDL